MGKLVKILLIEDDQETLDYVANGLEELGHVVDRAANGRDGLFLAAGERYDVMIVDRMLPGLDGLAIVKTIRGSGIATPVLFLTTLDGIDDRVEGLNAGADDYLVKPFAPAELVARLQALLRRSAAAKKEKPLSFADLHLDPVTRVTKRGDREFSLTPTEFDLLHYLLLNPRHVLSRARILERVWGYDFGGDDNVLEVYVGYLRKKTEAEGEPRLIHTVRGVGYVLREE
jgi:DNA-binding response OmpR family regulator